MSWYSSQTTLGSAIRSTVNFSEYSWPLSVGEISLQDLSLEEIAAAIKELTLSNLHVQLENDIFLGYLKRNESKLLLTLHEDIDEQAKADKRGKRRHSLLGLSGGAGSTTVSTHYKRKVEEARTSVHTPTARVSSYWNPGRGKEDMGRLSVFNQSAISSIHSFALNTASGLTSVASLLKVNYSKKWELVIRAIEELRDTIIDENKRYLVTRTKLHINRQQLEMALNDTRNARSNYQDYVISASKENIAHRIPAEKFVVFMEKWFKQTEKTICDLGLRVQKYKVIYVEKARLLVQRTELFENLRPVDIELVYKEMQEEQATLDAKSASITELKTMYMPLERKALILKEHINTEEKEMQRLDDLIKKREFSLSEIERHAGKTQTEVKIYRSRLEAMREHRDKYEKIDEMGYLHVKLEVARLRKEIKNSKRRYIVQHMNLKATKRIALRIKMQNKYLLALCGTSTNVHKEILLH